jgi:hypothetical protein
MLEKMEIIAAHLNGGPLRARDRRRSEAPPAFTSRSAADVVEELQLLGAEYEAIRARMEPGDPRTSLMESLVGRAQRMAGERDAGRIAEQLFKQDTDGARVMGLAMAWSEPQGRHVEMALSGIAHSRSAFEQFHALVLAERLFPSLEPNAAEQVGAAITAQMGKTITKVDPSRRRLAESILKAFEAQRGRAQWSPPVETITATLAGHFLPLVECRPSSPTLRFNDVEENHGPYVVTRGNHQLNLPRVARIGRYLVTHALYREFVQDGGYENDAFWTVPAGGRRRFVTSDGETFGPGGWPRPGTIPSGKDEHPVSSLSYLEARAFVSWCNTVAPDPNWLWTLPTEDLWEYAARSEAGLIYPWGDAFDASKCNSSESGVGETSEVSKFPSGQSRVGCFDMAGNVWEFVEASDAGSNWCVMRGGSYLNNRYEVRSYLRLQQVPHRHRPPDFGFRLAQVPRS